MKKIAVLIFALLVTPYYARAQTAQLYYAFTAQATGGVADTSLAPQVDALNVRISGINTTTSWTAQIQTSPDNVTWTSCGSLVTATSAASSSGGACTPSGAAFTRVLITAGTGGGSVVGALIGTCSLCQVASSGGITLTTTGTSGPATLIGGVLNIPQYSGGSLPSALTGQILTNTSGSTTYAGQANILYQQSGDTIASIETACTSAPCTYVVTSPQTITLAASHAMNSNVWVRFEADGKWNVTGAYTLSNVQVAPGTTTSPHFSLAGSAVVTLSTFNTLVPVEWFGAVGDWNGTTGTNNLTAIQNTINAITYGQAVLSGPYAIGGTLTYSASNVGLRGTTAGRGGYNPTTGVYYSSLIETVAGDDAIDVHGTSGTYLDFGIFQDFDIGTSVAQTGTAAGMSFSFTGGVIATNIHVVDFFYPFYLHASPSYGGIGFVGDTGQWSALSSGMTSPVCFYLPSTDGNSESSITLSHDACASVVGGPTSPIALLITGTAVNDINVGDFATAFTNGPEVVYTGSGGGSACSDIHITNETVDNFLAYADYVSGCLATQTGSVEISGGWAVAGAQTASTLGAMYILNSSGVSINHVQIGAHQASGFPAVYGVNIAGGGYNTVANNTIMAQNYAVNLTNNTVGNVVTGNTDTNSTGGTINIGMQINNGSTYNTLTSNSFNGANTITTGITIASGSNNNTYVGNTCGSNVTTCINDGGTGNGITGPLTITNSSSATLIQPFAVLTANLPAGAGHLDYIPFGVALTTNNAATLNFHFNTLGSATANLGGLGFYGVVNDSLQWDASGDVTVYKQITSPTFNTSGGRKGTFVCTAAGTITIANANELVTSDVVISLNTAGGTISTSPAMKTTTSGTGFTVLCGAADTSTYNYDILN